MIKLYDENSYTSEFSARVTSCEECSEGYRIQLDRTAFFPTAGGQECDTGTLDGKEVLRVEIENDTIYHILKTPLAAGDEVLGKIDWQVRFRKMQHHSAEHIVSGLAHSLFGLENVGFHLSDKEVTIDYSGPMSAEELLLLERKANEAVHKNIKIIAEYPPEDMLCKIPYRSKLDLTENVRLVTIDGIDICACCAPHVKHTGEIGLIKLKDLMRHRGGVRLKMICGMDALFDYEEKLENVVRISVLLSAKQEETADSVERLLKELAEQKQKTAALSKQLAAAKAAQIAETDGCICVFENDFDTDSLRLLANEGKKKCRGMFVALSGSDDVGYSYIIASATVNLRDAAKEMNSVLHGRGGGREDMIQGFFGAKRAEIEEYFSTL